jgi:hypothetical protein
MIRSGATRIRRAVRDPIVARHRKDWYLAVRLITGT